MCQIHTLTEQQMQMMEISLNLFVFIDITLMWLTDIPKQTRMQMIISKSICTKVGCRLSKKEQYDLVICLKTSEVNSIGIKFPPLYPKQ